MVFGVIDFLQKTNERIRLYYYDTSGRLVFVRFLEEIEDTKKPFRDYLTFKSFNSLIDLFSYSRLRANAVILVTCLLVEGSHSTSSHVNAEFISNGMAKLLNDSRSVIFLSNK